MLRFEACEIDNDGFRLSADFEIAAGRIVGVIGPSGGGKTTLLEAVAGFLPLAAGEIFWHGTPLSGLEPGKRPVAMLFQDGNLFPHLSVAQNVGLGIAPSLRLSAQDRGRVAAALARVGLEGLGERRPAALSGGQRARVALARLMVQARDIFLLDEPFAALGPALKAEMLALVAEIARERGATVLLVSHDPEDARQMAGEVVLVAGGRASAPVATKRLFADPPAALRDYLGEG